ncbi:YeiH family protein [Thalassotalea sp. PLHSN55]|uniref:YeiH family protein n=1 Tax=Thalassotalea sp. PLHSN55 TaxID=3435888 RepID=UPI003F83A504
MSFFKVHIHGIALCVLVAAIAKVLASTYQAPVMLLALLLGLALHFLFHSPKLQSGIAFCSTALLRMAVALVGVRIAFADVMSLGFEAPLLIIASMIVSMGFAVVLARLLSLPTSFGVLSGGAVAICGVSAAAAISTVLPKNAQFEKFFALTVVSITALGTMAMIFYPIVVTTLGLSDQLAGVFLGGAIHDVAQVAGAGYSVSETTGDIAMYIKLMRVALLLPIVMIIFWLFKGQGQSSKKGVSSFIPSFLVVFFVLALVNNLGLLPTALVDVIKILSQWFLVIAMVAIGIKTSLAQVLSVGWKPIFLLTCETLFFAVLIILGVLYCL